MDPAVVPPSGDDLTFFDDIQPVLSWADSVDDDEFEALDVVIPSWAVLDPPTVKAEDPKASPPVQRRAESLSFVRQKTEVWRKPAPSSYCRRSPPSGFIKRPERPVREASQTQRRSPPSWYCHRQEYRVRDTPPAQSRTPCSGFINREESSVKEASPQSVEKTPPSGSLKKRRPSLPLYIPPKCRPPTSGSHTSGVFKTPDPAVTEASPSQPQGPTANGVSSQDGQNTTPAKSVAQKQEMGGSEISSIPPTNTPAPVSEDTSLPSGSYEKLRAPLTQAPTLHHRLPPPGFFKRPDPLFASSTSSTGIGLRRQEGQNTTAKNLPQTQGVRSPLSTGCSVDELCKMLDALHLSKKPTSLTTPNRPKPLIRPATFVFQEQPTVGFAQHHTVSGLKTWTKPPAPPTPEPAAEHLPAPYPNPRPCLLGKKHCRKRPRPSSDS